MLDLLSVAQKININGLNLEFIGKSNIWLENDYVNDKILTSIIQEIVYQSLQNTAPNQLKVSVFDSILTGAISPFAALTAGESKVISVFSDVKGFYDYLSYLRNHIQEVQNTIQGESENLTNFRKKINSAVESYELVVLVMNIDDLDEKQSSLLSILMKKGPQAGVSFLVVSPISENVLHLPAVMDQNIQLLAIEDQKIVQRIREKSVKEALPPQTPTREIISFSNEFGKEIYSAALPTVEFSEVNSESQWSKKSTEGITFSVGKYGTSTVKITLGDEINQRHNILVTGAVGQGKSNLLSVIICSMCQNYSPEELNLYLLDFKEGVSLKPYAKNEQGDFLPHAKFLGLESDVNIGISVLNFLFDEYKKRIKLFKSKNKKSLYEYRKSFLDEKIPRIVVIIDEFQLMFGDENDTGRIVSELLEKSVRLFRAAGIHFILASQLSTGKSLNDIRDSLLSQIPIRIAHKNSKTESINTLGLNNPAAAYLRAHEAIVNLDYGEVTQNKKTIIAYGDEKILAELRHQWTLSSKNLQKTINPPNVFDNDIENRITNDLSLFNEMRQSSDSYNAVFGKLLSISGEFASIRLANEAGNNIALLGVPEKNQFQNISIIQSIATSLAMQHKDGKARFIFFNFENEQKFDEAYPNFRDILDNFGYEIENFGSKNFLGQMNELLKEQKENGDGKVYVFGFTMDKISDGISVDFYKESENQSFYEILEQGPLVGLHFIGWWMKGSNFTKQVTESGFGEDTAFNTKIFLKIDERTVQSLTSPFLKWNAEENRALLYNDTELPKALPFVPFALFNSEDKRKIIQNYWE